MILKRLTHFPIYFSVFSLVILYLGYSQNFWGALDHEDQGGRYYPFLRTYNKLKANDFDNGSIEADVPALENILEDFPTFDRYSESFVLGRLVKSRRDGLLSSGGFTGNFTDIPNLSALGNYGYYSPALFIYQVYQYKIYLDDSLDNQVGQFNTYKSQPGGQAFVLGILDKIIPGKNTFKLGFYYNLMALLTALTIFLIILWFYKEFGILTGLLLVFSFALFRYPTLYAKSLWWVIWALYIPFLLILYSHHREDVSCNKLSFRMMFLLGFIGMSFKIFLNGFEFITTTVLMTITPVVYYAVKNEWRFVHLINRLLAVGGGVCLSIIIFFVILTFQFALAGDTFSDGIDHIYDSFLRRTYGTEFRESVSDYKFAYEVTKSYILNSPALEFNHMGINLRIGVKIFLLISAIVSSIWVILIRGSKFKARRRIISALIVTLWFSTLAPISWFMIFSQHSMIHSLQDPVVWFMPFMFYCIELIGFTLAVGLDGILSTCKNVYSEKFLKSGSA